MLTDKMKEELAADVRQLDHALQQGDDVTICRISCKLIEGIVDSSPHDTTKVKLFHGLNRHYRNVLSGMNLLP